MTAFRDAIEYQSREQQEAERVERQSRERTRLVGEAIAVLPNPVETRALSDFAIAVVEGRPVRIPVEHGSITSANPGARGAVAVEAIRRPEWLYAACSIPFARAYELTVSGPLYAALVAKSATAEAQNKPAMTDPTLATATLAAFAVVQTVSRQVVRFGVGAQAVIDRLAAQSVISVNKAIADALETAAGAPLGYLGSASQSADLAIATVWAQTGARPTALVVNSEDYPSLSDKAAVGRGDTIGGEMVRFNGIPLLANDAITSGVGVAVNGRAFSAHGTEVLFASLPNVVNKTVTLRAETYFALLQHDEGAIAAVGLTGT
jgi:hypothetical protein